jgi:hypothetical protein
MKTFRHPDPEKEQYRTATEMQILQLGIDAMVRYYNVYRGNYRLCIRDEWVINREDRMNENL